MTKPATSISQIELPDIVFQDFDLQFLPHPDTGDVVMLKNYKTIMRSVKNLVLTNMYDQPYKPSIYSNVLASLFENFTPILVLQLKNAIRDVIVNWEPRAEYIDCKISEALDLDMNAIRIIIYVRPINFKQTLEIPLVLERIR